MRLPWVAGQVEPVGVQPGSDPYELAPPDALGERMGGANGPQVIPRVQHALTVESRQARVQALPGSPVDNSGHQPKTIELLPVTSQREAVAEGGGRRSVDVL